MYKNIYITLINIFNISKITKDGYCKNRFISKGLICVPRVRIYSFTKIYTNKNAQQICMLGVVGKTKGAIITRWKVFMVGSMFEDSIISLKHIL